VLHFPVDERIMAQYGKGEICGQFDHAALFRLQTA
jgi:hypothetical protein